MLPLVQPIPHDWHCTKCDDLTGIQHLRQLSPHVATAMGSVPMMLSRQAAGAIATNPVVGCSSFAFQVRVGELLAYNTHLCA